jgi:hypothetical protein
MRSVGVPNTIGGLYSSFVWSDAVNAAVSVPIQYMMCLSPFSSVALPRCHHHQYYYYDGKRSEKYDLVLCGTEIFARPPICIIRYHRRHSICFRSPLTCQTVQGREEELA